MQRLGKNLGRYFGETIDIREVVREAELAAAENHWKRDADFLAFHRGADSFRKLVYISAGIHGDEPGGPLAALKLLQENQWPGDLAIILCPCLNPTGFPLNRRENADGIDLNRDYRRQISTEVKAHTAWLERQPRFDVSLCLHEDWESNGFYVYEVNPDQGPSLGDKIVEAVARVCPVDMAPEIEGWPAQNGVIRPNINPEERPQWPEAMYLITRKTRQSYTLEAPSDFPLQTRVDALVAAVRAVLVAV